MRLNRVSGVALLGLVVLFSSAKSFALPTCYDNDLKTVITNSDQGVLGWLQNSNGWKRVLVTGVVTKTLPDQTGHLHFLVDLNGDGVSDVEIIHQEDFGSPSKVTVGSNVTVCGDFLKQGMDGVKGFVHWTHCNPGTRDPNHPQGFFAINGEVYGITAPQGEPACVPGKP